MPRRGYLSFTQTAERDRRIDFQDPSLRIAGMSQATIKVSKMTIVPITATVVGAPIK
jgi:hypothetical protein